MNSCNRKFEGCERRCGTEEGPFDSIERDRCVIPTGGDSMRSKEETLLGQEEICGDIDMQGEESVRDITNGELEVKDKLSKKFESLCLFKSGNSKESEASSDKVEKLSEEAQKNLSEKDEELKRSEIQEIQSEELVDSTRLEETETLMESNYLFRHDNVRKATIRALNKVVKVHVHTCIKDYYRETGKNLQHDFAKYRNEVYQCFKTCIEKVLGYSLSEIDTKEVYAILFDLCLRKKKPMKDMIKFSNREERKFIALVVKRYKKQGRAYTKEDGEYCFNHVLMKIAKNLYFSNDKYKQIFKKQVLDTRKKIGIVNRQEYLNRLIREMDDINYQS